jgi:hypothetical protein
MKAQNKPYKNKLNSKNMKNTKFISFALIVGMAFSLILSSCELNPSIKPQTGILPDKFSVDIPPSISNSNAGGRVEGRKAGRTAESLNGNLIYLNLATFIAVGEGAGKLVEEIILGIKIYHIDRVMTLTYVGDDDNRTKNLVVTAQVEYEGTNWDYALTITDADSEGNTDGGKALQVFWNKEAPVKGIAIIKPYNCDRNKNAGAPDAMFRINYSEAGDHGYDATMEVLISGLPLPSAVESPYAVNSLRMFVGKKGDVVDVYGNSNHPNAILFSGTPGFDWAFVASSNDSQNIGVAEVGLPSNTLDSDDRTVLLKDYSVKNVFTNEILDVWPNIDQTTLDEYLSNTAAPGYFNSNGFVSGGTSPGEQYDVLVSRLGALSPYNPKQVNELALTFK